MKPEDHLDYVHNVGNCIPRFYKTPRPSPESQRAVANNGNYCPDVFKHSRLLAEAIMETLKNIYKYFEMLCKSNGCPRHRAACVEATEVIWKLRSSIRRGLKKFGAC